MKITVAITGASGAIYPQRLLTHLVADPVVSRIYLVTSAAGLRVLREELEIEPLTLTNMAERLAGDGQEKIEVLSNNDVGASIASGSFPLDAMVVVPCSTGTLGAIAHGISRDLIQRAADVTLKERRKLILVVRDTPFSLVHLDNMRSLTLAGAIIFPAIPSFYHRPASLNDAVDQFLYRVMAHLGLRSSNAYQWKGSRSSLS
jgi:4-hydroxy-3-polyprenylbenzoate decarboxylase